MRNENEKQETYYIDNVGSIVAAGLKEEKDDLIKTKINLKKLGTYYIMDLARTREEDILEKKEDVHTDINTNTHCKAYLSRSYPSPPPAACPPSPPRPAAPPPRPPAQA